MLRHCWALCSVWAMLVICACAASGAKDFDHYQQETWHYVHRRSASVTPVEKPASTNSNSNLATLEEKASFIDGTIILSQLKSLFQLLTLDLQGAIQTQINFVSRLGEVGDNIPVFGHVKGLLLWLIGKKEAGTRAFLGATKTLGVLIGSLLGTFVVGPALGGLAGAGLGGLGADLINSVVNTVVLGRGPKGEVQFYGWLAWLSDLRRDPGFIGRVVDFLLQALVENLLWGPLPLA